MGQLNNVKLHLIENTDDVREFIEWVKRPREYVGIDTETSGLSVTHDRIRLIQFGDENDGWAMGWEDWRGVAKHALEILIHSNCEFVLHNSMFDLRHISQDMKFPIRCWPWHRTHDTMMMAHIWDNDRPKGLKPLSARLVDPLASAMQKTLDEGMANNGWDWETVPINFPPYWMYGSLDPVLSVLILRRLKQEVIVRQPSLYDLEMGAIRVAAEAEETGCRIDLDYTRRTRDKLRTYAQQGRAYIREQWGVDNPSGQRLFKYFRENGIYVPEKLTKTGQQCMDKEVMDAIDHPMADVIQNVKRAEKWSSAYLDNFLEFSIGDRIHPNINPTAARTARMCLPDTHKLLTRRGVISINDVVLGDETLDRFGNWTKVTAIHRYEDQETQKWEHSQIKLECTPEHKWVLSLEGKRDNKFLDRLDSASRRYIQLAQKRLPVFEKKFLAKSDKEKEAALIALLVTNGRCAWEDKSKTVLRCLIYQTERKFYKEIKELIPSEAISYDRVTTSDHHEIGLNARYMRPFLRRHGLDISKGETLKHSEKLETWILARSAEECAAFLNAVYLADGSVNHGQKIITCGYTNLQRVMRIAAYRSGYLSTVKSQPPSKWGTKDREFISFKLDKYCTRHMNKSTGKSDVWCVTTTSGTFTAWSDFNGPYLTGNSISNPALQQLPSKQALIRDCFIPSDGHVLISSDFDQIEARLMAHFCQDEGLIAAFHSGEDFFCSVASDIYHMKIEKKDAKRGLTKNTIYSKIYGASPPKAARTAKVPLPEMEAFLKAFENQYPGVPRHMRRVINEGKKRAQQSDDGRGWVTTPYGRNLRAERGKEYALVNYQIQCHAAEVFKRKLVELDSALPREVKFILPVHDEVLFDCPIELAAESKTTIEETMRDDSYSVPMTAGATILTERWGEAYR